MPRRLPTLWVIAASALLLGACGGHKAVNDTGAPAAGAPVAGASTAGADTSGASASAGSSAATGAAGADAAANAARILYFDFDASEIRPEYATAVTAHAHALGANASIRVRLEGHTDERGSREYNIGLGERRAQAVRRALMLQGAAESQITTVSYGEERPAQSGENEAAWAKNRRVEIIYLN